MYNTSVIYRYYIDSTNGRIFMDIKYETSRSRLVKTGGEERIRRIRMDKVVERSCDGMPFPEE